MKNLYLITCLMTIFVVDSALGQSLVRPENSVLPEAHGIRKNNVIPYVGFSVAVPLFKRTRHSHQLDKLLKLPQQPASVNARMAAPAEDGPIAWEYTGEEVTVYVSGSSGGGSPGTYFGSVGYNDPNWGGIPFDGGDPTDYYPIPITKARKVPKNYCQNGKTVFKNMWDKQAQTGKEQAAFITDKGIFWLDDASNTATTYYTGSPAEYTLGPDGKRYFISDGEIFTILGIVHTHPVGGAYGMTDPDKANGAGFNVPNFAITDNGVYSVRPGQNTQVADYNSSNAFDCSLANNLFGI